MNLPEKMSVISQDGVHGRRIANPGLSGAEPMLVLIRFDTGQEIFVPADLLTRREDGTYQLSVGLEELEKFSSVPWGQAESRQIPVIHETAEVIKKVRDKGRARFTKVVRDHEEMVDVSLLEEEVQVRRVPIRRPVDGPVPVRREGDTLIVPLLKEALVVQKQLMLEEEVHITRVRKQILRQEPVRLRHEEMLVERLEAEAGPEQESASPDVDKRGDHAV